MKILDNLIETGLIFLIIFTPLAFGTVHVWAYTLFEIAVLILVCMWTIKMIYSGKIRILKNPLNYTILAFLCLISSQLIPMPEVILKLISPNTYQMYFDTYKTLDLKDHYYSPMMSFSLNPYATIIELYKVLAYMGVFYLIVENMDNKRIHRILLVIMFIGFSISIFGLIQHFTWNGKIYWYRELTHGGSPFGPFINRNNFAGYINLIIPISLSMVLIENNNEKKILFGFMSLVMVIALSLSLSRSGFISFFSAMVFMGSLFLFKRSKNNKGILLLGCFLTGAFIYLSYIGIDPVLNRLVTLTEGETYLNQGRIIVWGATLEIVKDFKILGAGLDTFETIFPYYQPLEVSRLYWLDAHNDYIQFAAETGVIGMLIGLTFVVKLFKAILSSLYNEQILTFSYLLIGLISSIVAFMISVIFTFNSHIPANALLFTIVIAIAVKSTVIMNQQSK